MSLPAPAPVLDLPAANLAPVRANGRVSVARYAPILVVVVALAAGLAAVDTLPTGGFYDDAFYVILAKSLATGHGYRNLNLPGAPFATHYPPGYPLFLAVLWKIGPAFPANVVLFKLANVVFLALVAGFAYRLGRERMGLTTGVTVVAVIVGTATTPALYLSSMVLSETLFLALTLALLLRAERVTTRAVNARAAIGLGTCAGLLFLVRSQAIALIGAIALSYVVRRRWREAGAAIGAAGLVMLPWLVWTAVHDGSVPALMRGDYGSYFAWFLDGVRERGLGIVLQTFTRNVPNICSQIVHRLQPPANPLSAVVASLCAALLGLLGIARLVRRAPVTMAFLGGYLVIAAVWPFPPLRFLLGVWVLLMLVLAAGVDVLIEGAPGATRLGPHRVVIARAVGALASIVLVGGIVAYNVRGYQRRWWATTEEASARWIAPKISWVGSHTDTSAVIATDHDEGAIYLYTGRRAVPLTTFSASEYVDPRTVESDVAALHALVAHFKPNYIVLSSVRLQPAAAAASVKGVPLNDGAHQIVPWAFTLSR
ncbi:MAG: hypothetical protein ACJ796_04195 [Gemmatimonadaceae bacterium]